MICAFSGAPLAGIQQEGINVTTAANSVLAAYAGRQLVKMFAFDNQEAGASGLPNGRRFSTEDLYVDNVSSDRDNAPVDNALFEGLLLEPVNITREWTDRHWGIKKPQRLTLKLSNAKPPRTRTYDGMAQNLVNPDDFSEADWVKTGATTAGASLITFGGYGIGHQVYQGTTPNGETETFKITLRAANGPAVVNIRGDQGSSSDGIDCNVTTENQVFEVPCDMTYIGGVLYACLFVVSGDLEIYASDAIMGEETWTESDDSRGYFSALEYAGVEFRGAIVNIYQYEPLESPPVSCVFQGEVIDYNILMDVAEFIISDEVGLDALFPPEMLTTDTFSARTPDSAFRPDVDFGKPLPYAFGWVRDLPCLLIQNDTDADEYDYLLCTTMLTSITPSNLTVYRFCDGVEDWVVVDPSEYTLLSQYTKTASPKYPYAIYYYYIIRFTAEQKAISTFCQIKADFLAGALAEVAERNHITVLERLLSWSGSINSPENLYSVPAALQAVYDMGIKCDLGISEQRTYRDIINDLLQACGCAVEITTGLFGMNKMLFFYADMYSAADAATFGYQDGYYNNIREVTKNGKVAAEDAAKMLTLKYRYSPAKGGTQQELSRHLFSWGKTERVKESRCTWEHDTADRILCRQQRRLIFGQRLLGFTAGMEARNLLVNNVVRVIIPELDIDGRFQILSIRRVRDLMALDLKEYSHQSYIHVPADTLPTG